LIALALTGLNLFLYAQVHAFPFVNFDDPTYVTANPHVQSGLSWTTVMWALTTGQAPYWHPLTWLSHLLDVQLFGLDAGAHHVVNVAFHAATTLALFFWLLRVTSATWRSGFVAAAFAVHPLHVESVAWITERKDVLSGLFWMVTLLAYTAFVARPGVRRYAWVLLSFALALMAKPMAVTLPVVLLLLDVWPLGRITSPARWSLWTPLVREKLPLVALAIAAGVVTVLVQARVGAVADLTFVSWPARLGNAIVSYVLYLGMFVWPNHLAVFYPLRDWSAWQVLGSAITLIGVTAGAVAVRGRYPYLLAGWGWYLVTLAPVIGLLQVGQQAMADRFMYLPIVGVLIAVAWGVPDLWEHGLRQAGGRRLMPILAAVFLVFWSVSTRAQVRVWSDSVTLWEHAIETTGGNYLAYEDLGLALRERGDLAAALEAYTQALNSAPGNWIVYRAQLHNTRGLVLQRQGKAAEALNEFTTAVSLNPGSTDAQTNAGNTLASSGRFSEAGEHFAAALRITPDLIEARLGLANVLVARGQAAAAIAAFEEVVRLQPSLAEAHSGLGSALAMAGRSQDALSEYQAALRLKPDLTTAYFNMAVLLVKRGQVAEARQCLQRALAIDPSYEDARRLLADLALR